ncbi:hypothetical protein LTR08_006009 [Meristemomyces frigidus]|nr:hypothetical protein LTR08_006009 [Meristemomyces frigidus]
MVCTSFAGAQVAIIGVDCFSRAGLKEFWVYIWNLNHNEFPIDTTSYPVTRGIRAEIACTVVMFLFGVMSQYKLWRVIKERRLKKEEERIREEEDRGQLASAVGKDIEIRNARDRAQWEAVYGDKDVVKVHVDSGAGSSTETIPKRSASVRERSVDDVEMADMSSVSARRASQQKARRTTTFRGASDDESEILPTQLEEHLLGMSGPSRPTSHNTSPLESKRTSLGQPDGTSVGDWPPRSSATIIPAVVALPFTILRQDREDAVASNFQPVVSKDTVREPFYKRPGIVPEGPSFAGGEDIDNDDTSSVAATADEDADAGSHLFALLSPCQLNADQDGVRLEPDDERDSPYSPRCSTDEVSLEETDDEAVIRPETAVDKQPLRSNVLSMQRERRPTASTHRRSNPSRRSKQSGGLDEDGDEVSMVGSLKTHLPLKLSKVAMTYRTKEWAKHIAGADKSDCDSVSEPSSPGVQVVCAFADEAVKPIDDKVPEPGKAIRATRSASDMPSRQASWEGTQTTPNNVSRSLSQGVVTPATGFPRSRSAAILNRQSSSAALKNQRLILQNRNLSAPLPSQAVVESPVEDTFDASAPYRRFSSPWNRGSTTTLMDERNHRLKRKPGSTSFNALSSALKVNVVAPSEPAYSRNSPIDERVGYRESLAERKPLVDDEEDMTLAERKVLIQQRQRDANRKTTWPVLEHRTSAVAMTDRNTNYDSHQPKRTNTVDTVKQSTMLSQWRQSLQQDAASREPLVVDEYARQAMLDQHWQVELQQQLHQQERMRRQSAIDFAGRSGRFNCVHREAMSKMQAEANKRAKANLQVEANTRTL